MKQLMLAAITFLLCGNALASTWECIDSTDGHKYIVSQDVMSDSCRKINNSASPVTTAPEVPDNAFGRAASRDDELAMAYAHSDSFCVKMGKLTASAARILELGGTEKDLIAMNSKSTINSDFKSNAARRSNEITKAISDNMIAYVFTVKPSPESARLIGYKKCLAGDFD